MPSERIRSPSLFGFAPAQSCTVSGWAAKTSRDRIGCQQIDEQITGLGQQLDAFVYVVEADSRGGHRNLRGSLETTAA
jgi:hypothetical protein